MSTVILGGNTFKNCEAVLVINRVEVFRFRGRTGDGQLIVDFEIRDLNDEIIAKVAKNNIVFAKGDKYQITHGEKGTVLKNVSSEQVIASVHEVSGDSISVIGTFHVAGDTVTATSDELILPKMNKIVGSEFSGLGKAIEIEDGEIRLGQA